MVRWSVVVLVALGAGCTSNKSTGPSPDAATSDAAIGLSDGANRPPDTAADGARTSPGATTFRVRFAPGAMFCDSGTVCDRPVHLTIKSLAGQTITGRIPFCPLFCSETCAPPACPGIACLPAGLPFLEQDLTWDGQYYEGGTCGAGMACVRSTFSPPGRYLAVICATPGTIATPDAGGNQVCTRTGEQECQERAFDLPSATPIEVTLGLSSNRDR
jgi:hypothetical protein